ncbi:9340_t:CDS:2, partial [Cetraspora pellucida]
TLITNVVKIRTEYKQRLSLKSIIQNLMKSEETKDDLDLDIVEIDLPPLKPNNGRKFLKLFTTFSKLKGLMINCSLKLVRNDVASVVKYNEFKPDVGGWNARPTRQQRIAPIINSSPPPLLWIEVSFNKTNDRDYSLNVTADSDVELLNGVITQGPLYAGYYRIGHIHKYRVHRLMALAFCSKEEGKEFVNHIVGDSTNKKHLISNGVQCTTCGTSQASGWLDAVKQIIDVFFENFHQYNA